MSNRLQEMPYKASLTREQFLFYEMRTTARLMSDGLSEDEVVRQIVEENLFQYPTEKSMKRMAAACIRRLKELDDEQLISAIAHQPAEEAKQICLYAMMRQSRLVWEFMITVIGRKYRQLDESFGKKDLNIFFMQLQEQNDAVAAWSDSTVTRIKQILKGVLIENGYLDNARSEHLNPVWLYPFLENAIRAKGEEVVLPAFNCLS